MKLLSIWNLWPPFETTGPGAPFVPAPTTGAVASVLGNVAVEIGSPSHQFVIVASILAQNVTSEIISSQPVISQGSVSSRPSMP